VLGILYALGMSLCWAGSGIAMRKLSTFMDPFVLNGVRAAFSLVALGLLFPLMGDPEAFRALTTLQIFYLIASVILGGVVADTLYVAGLRLLGMSRCFPIVNSYPLFTVLFGVLFLGEPLEWQTLLAAALVLVGIYFVVQPARRSAQAESHPLPGRQLIRGGLIALLTAIIYGLECVIISVGAEGVNGLVANGIRVPVVVIVSLAIAAPRGALKEIARFSWRTIWLLVAAGVLGWSLAGTFWVLSIQALGPGRAAIIGSAAPLFAAPMNRLFLGERPSRLVLAGTVLTVLGIVLVV